MISKFVPFLLSFLFVLKVAADNPRPDLPNIVFMMADDMGIGDTSAYLGRKASPYAEFVKKTLRTPNLESFAEKALVFTNAYAPASMCSSTRYSLLTGRFAHRSYLKQQGWLPHGPNAPMIQRELTTLPEMLKRKGYRTAAIGKYHVGMSFSDSFGKAADDFDYHDVDFTKLILDGPTHHGFEEFFGVPGNTEDPLDTEPRVFIRDDHWTFNDRNAMKYIGMKNRKNRILAAPDWDLAKIGPTFLGEALAFLKRQESQSESPFFLYYVPCANHFQRNPSGDYAVPDVIAGVEIKDKSRYSDNSTGSDREDMVLENDAAFGALIKSLREMDDPRWPGHKMIENTLVIFTSDNGPNVGDNLGWNPESGGLRGKKAKIWEGGIRVPFLVSLPGRFEGGTEIDSIFSLTDLFATLANLTGYELMPSEAQDSQDSLVYWEGAIKAPDTRPRVFFCHLGPPYSNDVLAIRKGNLKVIVDGGLVMPWGKGGQLGASAPVEAYNLEANAYEKQKNKSGEDKEKWAKETLALAEELLKIHNRGHARKLNLKVGNDLIYDPGWHNLRNDLNGEIGFQFSVEKAQSVTHLGMWVAPDSARPARRARAVGSELDRDRPARAGRNTLSTNHVVRLVTLEGKELARVEIVRGEKNKNGEFHYKELSHSVNLLVGAKYFLLQSTRPFDGDPFRDPASFDGLSPLIHPQFCIEKSVLIQSGDLKKARLIPAFADLHEAFSQFRLPVGPSLKVKSQK